MTSTDTLVTREAWLGRVRSGSGFLDAERQMGDRLESGAAVFSVPESDQAARKTTVVRRRGQICIFTGHLFNRRELSEELVRQGEYPKDASDSAAELVLEGYRQWGAEVLARLEGVFVLALWDQRAETLLAARDPMGLHPFYYALAGRELVFSWDAETVRRHPGVPRELDRIVLAEYLMNRWMSQEETAFQGVRRLPPAHGLSFHRGRLQVFRYWDPAPLGQGLRWVTREEISRFPELLRKAVERTMECGRTGILLSGGLDSIGVAAMASEIASERQWPAPRALSVIFSGEFSEEPVQRRVAEALGFPQTFVDMRDYRSGRGLLGRLVDCTAGYPWPPLNVFSPAYSDLLRRARSQGCEVVLTGEGGDEWLTVGPDYAADLIRSGRWRELARLARTVLRSWNLPVLPALRNLLWTHGLRTLARSWIWRRAPWLALRRRRQLIQQAIPAWLAPDPALRRELVERFEGWGRPGDGDSFYVTATREYLSHPLISIAAEENFYRDTMAGITTMHPYLDRQLVDFLLRTPPELLNSGDRSKAPVRQTLAERFPQLGFEKQRKVKASKFNEEIYRREGPGLWQELGQARLMAELGIVELAAFHEMLETCLRSDHLTLVHRFWHAAGTEAWVRCHI
ncbi:MAG: hypothetical protein HY238_18140 [Acidobacteria bacterium]|nr:hypothetical protein [Acidobacteriota bacterium]